MAKDIESAIPNGASGYYLLGLITEKLVRIFIYFNRIGKQMQ